ncbi:unnamed protein product [Peronospora belbahrii]|uniref:Timeless N-terminal domain-containing protein n=1 Tax=Peronospora belbahrii TaxID=622444 RepID=A0ABN8CV99_9STRA|nr:unnamed protein product [Peronospora belbahrii]
MLENGEIQYQDVSENEHEHDDHQSHESSILDDAIQNELLLVCSNLGMLQNDHKEEKPPVLIRSEDCELWIHDLQRVLRRDHMKYRLITKQLGKWKIVQKKLLPLLVTYQHDWSLVLSILKVLVMLTTKPPTNSTNLDQQLKYLRQYKYEFLSSRVISIFMTILLDPLSKKRATRTEQDYLSMEIILMLFRNLLAIPNEDARYVTSTTSHFSHLQEDFIIRLHEENVYEMILLFAQDIESPENREWNLLVMEMLDLTLDCSQPKSVVAYVKKQLTGGNSQHSGEQVNSTKTSSCGLTTTRSGEEDLLGRLKSEKNAAVCRQSGSRRHSNFGGVLTMVGPTGRTTVLSDFSKTVYDQVPQAAKKPTSQRKGKKSITPVTDIHEIFGGKGRATEADERTMRVLQDICDSVIIKSYFQLMNSLKTEFRRGSTKLIATDRLQYFHLVWFLTSYHRLKVQALKSNYKHQLKSAEKKRTELQNALDCTEPLPSIPEKPDYNEKAVLATLDMFSFNFVLQSIENYATMKHYHGMTVSVQLLAEMMAYLAELSASNDSRLQRIADSLQHKIFYERDFLDRLPVLLKTWSPGLLPRAYVIDVVTLTHLVFKELDSQGTIKVLSRRKAYLDKKRQKKKRNDEESKDGVDSDGSSTDEEETEKQAQLLMEMQRKEADFDVRKYFSSMVSADTVRMYCSLLADYRENSAIVNHYIHSFLYRINHFKIYPQEKWTMQPMLFNMRLLLIFDQMLQDTYIQRLPEYKNFLDFIRSVVRDFFALADNNNLLFVEALLRQTYPSRSCMLIQRSYDPIDFVSKSKSEAVAPGRDRQIEAINESRRHRIALDHEELEGEAEVQFTLGPLDFKSTSLVDKDDKEDEGMDESKAVDSLSSPSKTAFVAISKSKRMTSSRAAAERAKNWSKVEDRYLAKVFMKFRHLPSVYEVISYEDMFQERDRTPEQIKRRVKYLQLYRKTHDSSDEDEVDESKSDGAQDEVQEEYGRTVRESRFEKDLAALNTVRPRRRLRRGADLSDDDSDDDMLLGGLTADPLQLSSAATTSEAVVGVSDAVSDEVMNGRNLTGDLFNEISLTKGNDALKSQQTQVVESFQQSCPEHHNGHPPEAQPTQKPRSTQAVCSNVVAKVASIDDAKVGCSDESESVIAEMEVAAIHDNRDFLAANDTTDAQPHKRARSAEGDDMRMDGTHAKKVHRKDVEVALNINASSS